ncbi:type I secretion system permease/ATPase [Salinarimonas sp.]|uniref:type I secretion system permease/ATPase n=1 Tax=Salinarimonas sp. TaxID=2766526 RepID=UPI0032D8C6FF
MSIAAAGRAGSHASEGPAPTELQKALAASRGSLLLVFLFSCGYNLLLLAPPLYLLQIYDRVLASRSVETLIMLTLVVVMAVAVGAALDYVRRAAMGRIGAWLEERLRPGVVTASFEYARRGNAQVAAEATRDLAALRQFIASPASVTLFDAPWALVFLGVLFLVHPLLGAIGAVGAVAMLTAAIAGEILTKAPAARAQLADAATHRRLAGALRNVQTIRAMGMLDGAADLVCRDVEGAGAAHASAMRRAETLQSLSRGTRALVQILIMGAAAWLVLREHLSAGIIFASSLLLGRALAPMEGVVAGWKAGGGARTAFGRLQSVLRDGAPPRDDRPFPLPAPRGAVALEGVTWVPPGTSQLVVQGFTCQIAPGECVGVIGPSGAGKSTLARLMTGVVTPSVGRVRLDGADIALWIKGGGSRHLGYLPQEVELFDGSVRDNIARLADADPEAVVEAARLAGVHDAILRLPDGYDTFIGEGGAPLSGGQRQLIGLARAFFGSPSVVVLDEPNAHLDEAGEKALNAAVKQVKARGATIVIVTHRFGILDLCDKVAILRQGALTAYGTSEEIYQRFFSTLQSAAGTGRGAPPPTPAAKEDRLERTQARDRIRIPKTSEGMMQWL